MHTFKDYLTEGVLTVKAHRHLTGLGYVQQNPVSPNAKAVRIYKNAAGETAHLAPDGRYAEFFDASGKKTGQQGFRDL